MTTRDIVFSACLAACLLVIGFLTVTSIMLFDGMTTQYERMEQQQVRHMKDVKEWKEKYEKAIDYIKRTKRVDRD